MTLHQNIHPSYVGGKARQWTKITARFNDSSGGACVILNFEDQGSDDTTICLHYGEAEYAQGFVDKLKTAVLSLPAIVGESSHRIAGFEDPKTGYISIPVG